MRLPTAALLLLAFAACARPRATGAPAPPRAAPGVLSPAPIATPEMEAPAPPAAPAPAPAAVSDLFHGTVQPLLARSCTPCHVPGGRMYDRLPFDDPETVRSKKEGILRRLKAPEDRQAFEAWLASVEESR